MPKRNELIAVCISDLHLSLTPPACRADKDWLETQAGYLQQVKDLAGGGPVLCAGDIFDRWNAPPELINFALQHLPDGMICVPGQHDLPNHQMEDMHRSGYGVLVQAEKIVNLSDGHWRHLPWIDDRKQDGGVVAVFGFGWGQDICSPKQQNHPDDDSMKVTLIHQYVWVDGKGFPGAPDTGRVSNLKKQLTGYDVAVTGDNHQDFQGLSGNCLVFNCGGFIRRKSDEIARRPRVGLLYADGTIESHKLDTSKDVFHEGVVDRPELPIDMKSFVDGLKELGEQGLNFQEAVEQHLAKGDYSPEVRQIIKQALESNANH